MAATEHDDEDFESSSGCGPTASSGGPSQWHNLVHNHLRSDLHGSEIGRAIAVTGMSYIESDKVETHVDFLLRGGGADESLTRILQGRDVATSPPTSLSLGCGTPDMALAHSHWPLAHAC